MGFGKPPKHSQFQPGQSGNPKGRPKGSHNFKTDVRSTLKAPVRVTRDGKPRKISTQEAMLLRLREMALSGDGRALDRLIALAQTYNNEELTASAGLSADDASILAVFRARVLSGAASAPDTGESTIDAREGQHSVATTPSAEAPDRAPIPRAPFQNPLDSNDRPASNVVEKKR